MDAVQALDAIGQMDEQQLGVAGDAISARYKELQAQRGREALMSLKKGDSVELCAISPKFLAGCKGTVEKVGKHVLVKIDEGEWAARDRRGKTIAVHASCVKLATGGDA